MRTAQFIISDDDILVDQVIADSRKKGEVSLPSFGRSLVPYFVPGAADFDEGAVNTNTDVDAHRRAGASVLDIPVPGASVSIKRLENPPKNARSQSSRRPARKHARIHPDVGVKVVGAYPSHPISLSCDASPISLITRASCSSSSDSEGPDTDLQLSSYSLEKWAGPAYTNSPPPSSLPLPSFSFSPLKDVRGAQLVKSAPPSPIHDLISSVTSSGKLQGHADLKMHTKASYSLQTALQFDLVDSDGKMDSPGTATCNLKKLLQLE